MELPGLYLSIPFCRSKCTYCNFASGVFPAAYHERYVERLEEDLRAIRLRAESWGATLPEAVDSIYLGGGTPTLLAPELLRRLFVALRREFAVMPTAEITVECAPGQLPEEVLAALAECGVSRVSFGVQSFVDREARQTGRLHTRETALKDIGRVKAAGIRGVNADLIAGLPGQTLDSWFESLEVLADAGVDHASVYMLEVDEESRLGRELMTGGARYAADLVPSEDRIAEMYTEAIGFLAGQGLAQYEISNFARPGHESQHNLKYWRREPYVGFGLDAHSMLRARTGTTLHAGEPAHRGPRTMRFATTDALDGYLSGPGWEEPQRQSREQELEEAWFLGLRLNEGVSLAGLREEFGAAAVHDCLETVRELEDEGLVALRDGGRVTLTARGRMLSNEVFARFLTEPALA